MASETDRPGPAPGAMAELAVEACEPRSAAANRPVELNDPDVAWFVARGALDVFVAEHADGEVRSASKHLMRLGPGRLAFGAHERLHDSGLQLTAKGLADTRLYRVPLPAVLDRIAEHRAGADGGIHEELVVQVDAWITGFAAAVARDITPRPVPALLVTPGQEAAALGSGILAARHGVAWLRGADLEAAFLEVEEAADDGPGLMPVTQEAWVELRRTAGVTCVSSRALGSETLVLEGVPEFHRLALGAEAMHRRLMLADEANLQVARFSGRRRAEELARQDLAALAGARRPRPAAATSESALVAALQVIARHEGFSIRVPPAVEGREPTLQEIVEWSGLRARRVRLAAEDRWWTGDSGALLAFRRAAGGGGRPRPVALLPGAVGRYRLFDPAEPGARRVRAGTRAGILDEGWLLYRTLPGDRAVGMKDLFTVAGGTLAGDLARLAAAGGGAGLLALAPAVAVNLLVGSVIPGGTTGVLAHLAAVLVGLAFVTALAHLFRGTAVMRLEGRLAARIGAALWDRLLRLRPGFYRRFTAGELAMRAMTFQMLRDRVSGVAADALLSTLFLLPTFGLLFFYDAALGWLTAGFGVVTLAVTATLAVRLVGPQRRYFENLQRVAGDLLQFLGGIVKLRATGAEGSAFAAWARRYRRQKQEEIRIAVLTEHVTAFSAAVPALAAAALFAVALGRGRGQLAPAGFLAVYTAAMMFYAAVARLGRSLQAVAAIVPGCEQVRPILAAGAGAEPRGGARVVLQGELALQRISFRYAEQGPMVLRDVSIHASPGELVAIVGESGVGKSTLFRIALGLEDPSSGAVYYDGRDLAHLDRGSVRRQIGVVTQGGGMQGGTILSSIIGVGRDLTVDDAWRAAREAAVDRDIAAMPMEMFTTVGESAATFSGGQNQRIRIAAALVHEPRIIFLDEPTSWLDNKSQAETMAGIERSVATRIVIAHRLSTIRNANRIYVLQAGRVAQVGGFDELIEQDGPFRDLARRQMA